jgi:hypothetical protein
MTTYAGTVPATAAKYRRRVYFEFCLEKKRRSQHHGETDKGLDVISEQNIPLGRKRAMTTENLRHTRSLSE